MADFFQTGAVEFYVKPRTKGAVAVPIGQTVVTVAPHPEGWRYLGACVGWPTVEATALHRDLTCDRSGDGAWQKVGAGERHVVTGTLSRLNYATLALLRTGVAGPTTFANVPGKLLLNVKDVELFLRYAIPYGGGPVPAGASTGRLYYSAKLEVCREAEPKRAREVGLVFECNQLWDNKNRKWKLYTDDPTSPDFPKDLKADE